MSQQDDESRSDNEVQFLMNLLKKAAAEREQLLLTIAKKDGVIAEQNLVVEELSAKRSLEADVFAKTLTKERKKFDRRIVKFKDAAVKRDELLVAWTSVGVALSVSHPQLMKDTLQPLVHKTCKLVPEAQHTSTSVYRRYVSQMLEGQELAADGVEAWNSLASITTPPDKPPDDIPTSPNPTAASAAAIKRPIPPSSHSNSAHDLSRISAAASLSQHSPGLPNNSSATMNNSLMDLEKMLGIGPMMNLTISDDESQQPAPKPSDNEETDEQRGITIATQRSTTANTARKFWWDHLVEEASGDDDKEGPATSSEKGNKNRLMLGSGLDDALDVSDND